MKFSLKKCSVDFRPLGSALVVHCGPDGGGSLLSGSLQFYFTVEAVSVDSSLLVVHDVFAPKRLFYFFEQVNMSRALEQNNSTELSNTNAFITNDFAETPKARSTQLSLCLQYDK